MSALILAGGWLLFVWVTLTGSLSLVNLIAGGGAAAALLLFFRPTYRDTAALSFRPWHALRFAIFFNLRFVSANLQVARAVLTPARAGQRRALIAVPIAAATEVTTTLLANAVSLTPGTCIVDMHDDPAVLYVHILQLRSSLTAQKLEILDLE